MENEIKYAFIASPKVIRHKLGRNTADVLAVLIYKNRYWKLEEKLFEFKGDYGFHISMSDIEEETCIKCHTIKKSLAILKKENLVKSKQQGLGKPNFYSIDEKLIDKYIEDNNDDYEDWRLKVRAQNKLGTPIDSKKELKQLSRMDSDNFQEGTQTTTTKNKITKNKITKNFTNRINADRENFDLSNYTDKLEKLIDDIKGANDDEERKLCNMELFDFLCKIIPRFKKFNISEQDIELINAISSYDIYSFHIADKILSNAQAILDGKKPSRFGNLFIGLDEINGNCKLRYG